MKHIITSGCSFSEKGYRTWPRHLAKIPDTKVYTLGLASAGNSWIAKTAIQQAHALIQDRINSSDILMIVMWSGIDRKDLFISARETPDFNALVHPGKGEAAAINPVSFIDSNVDDLYVSSNIDGYLVGSMHAYFDNENIRKAKKDLIMPFFSDESLAIESYENFLRVQWFCKSNQIKLVNLTYMDIMHYPAPSHHVLTKDYYRNVGPLHDMIDFTDWIFWKNTGGMYEYSRDNNLVFESDKVHPAQSAHSYFVDNFLMPELINRRYI
jgi:hypothetical protein